MVEGRETNKRVFNYFQIREMFFEKKMSRREIWEALGCSAFTVYNALKEKPPYKQSIGKLAERGE